VGRVEGGVGRNEVGDWRGCKLGCGLGWVVGSGGGYMKVGVGVG